MNYYVYYKLAGEANGDMRAKVQAFFALVEQQYGVRGRWLRRRDDPTTYMEVYEGIRDTRAFDALLERVAVTFGVPRKVERFISAETPA